MALCSACSARDLASWARCTLISSGRSAVCARIVTFVRQNFSKAPPHRQVSYIPALLVGNFANTQLSDQRSVLRKRVQIARFAGYLDLFNLLADQQTIGGDDFEFERVCHLDRFRG